MKKVWIFAALALCVFFTACRKDKSDDDKYTTVQGWIYHEMTHYYLFYNDVPAKARLDFNLSAENFLRSAASSRDMKNGYLFSHIERTETPRASKHLSSTPGFGFEAAILRDSRNRYYFRVLYTQANSPAREAGLKRGDWIIQVNGHDIGSNGFQTYISRPTGPCTFTRGYIQDGKPVPLDTVTMPAPRIINEENLLIHKTLDLNGKKAVYMLYNGFDIDDFTVDPTGIFPAGADYVILDMRYNPGGYVSTAQKLCCELVPREYMNRPLFSLIYNDLMNHRQTFYLEPELRGGDYAFQPERVYIIASENTASAAELVINALRPYLRNNLYHVGTATYGKNLAQTALTDAVAPSIKLWLTTCYISNSEGFYDYFARGLQPDFYVKENFSGDMGELATEQDILCRAVFNHIEGNGFGTETVTSSEASASSAAHSAAPPCLIETDNTLWHKAKLSLTD